ncbi:hypothetical protein [Arenimonas daejeonensis]|uniref:hypothetical protein n=1 Tax=Arenimonas daejeonensis TaxID=370777 RepID=UPI0011BD77D4|nr:hypothetical protein [Arenimonas daejeonensis]
MKFHPRLHSCLVFAGRLCAWVVASLLVVALVADLLNGRPPLNVIRGAPLTIISIVLGMWLAFAATFYVVLWLWTWTVHASGLDGRSYWGRRVHIRWEDVGQIYATSIEGIPALGVVSLTSKREIMLYVLGVDWAEAHRALLRHAGPDHALTHAFAPSRADSRRDI